MAKVIVGTNDILRARFDAAAIQAALAHVTGSLSAAGTVVLTMRVPNYGMMLGLSERIHRYQMRRSAPTVRPVLKRSPGVSPGPWHCTRARIMGVRYRRAGGSGAGRPESLWSPRNTSARRWLRTVKQEAAEVSYVRHRLNLQRSCGGARQIAGCFHDRLAEGGYLVGPRPAAEPTSPPPTRYDTAAWMATRGTAWVLRRGTDLLPYLLFTALRECWPGPGWPPQPSPRTAQPASAGGPPAGPIPRPEGSASALRTRTVRYQRIG